MPGSVRSAVRLLAAAVLAVLAFAEPASAAREATITRTAQDIPTIKASTLEGGGYGVGYAMAEDNVCEMAEIFTTLEGRRSEFFGTRKAVGTWSGATPSNVDSDYYHAYINASGSIERLLETPPPAGPTPEVFELVDGFVAGYNSFLRDTGADKIEDPRCRGAAWVRPITRTDIGRRAYGLANRAGRGLAPEGIANATPPKPLLRGGTRESAPSSATINDLVGRMAESANTQGSNSMALGSEATTTGRGILVHNPHWTWDGLDRFWQYQLNVPGQLRTSGMTFLGTPITMIGHNEHVAWTATVSATRRLAVVRVPLLPSDPTKYIVNGRVREMTRTPVTIRVREADGRLTTRTRTIYGTIHGPVTTSFYGLGIFPWTSVAAFAIRDVGDDNARLVNQFFEFNKSTSVRHMKKINDRYQGNPWATHTAADDQGEVYFADGGAVPNISNAHADRCNTVLGRALWRLAGLAVLDGSRGTCDVPNDPRAAAPRVMPADRQPSLIRRDYATNSNEGAWLTHAEQKLEGYSRIFGPERSHRWTRTRTGLRLVAERLAGTDGRPGDKFSRQAAQDVLFDNRSILAEEWAGPLAQLCRSTPRMVDSTFAVVDVRAACPAIENWDRRFDLDSGGAILFARFLEHVSARIDSATAFTGLPNMPFWRRPFNPDDPVNTPSGLNVAWPGVSTAFARAVRELRQRGIPLDATQRGYTRAPYAGTNIGLHGNDGMYGVFNAMNVDWTGNGFEIGGGGPSFVMVTSFTDGCVDDRSLLLGSQRSEQSGWPLAGEQVKLYAKKEWVDPPFCEGEIKPSDVRSETKLGPDGAQR